MGSGEWGGEGPGEWGGGRDKSVPRQRGDPSLWVKAPAAGGGGVGFPGASQVYRPLPGIPEGLDSPLAFLLVATALNAGLAGRPGMQLSWWVGLHLGNGAQSRARPVTQEPPSGLCPAQSFPGTSALLSFGRESVSEREGLGVLGCWGLRFQLCCKSRGCSVVGNGEGHPPIFWCPAGPAPRGHPF